MGRKTSPMAVAYQNAWQKLDNYYNLTNHSHSIYAAAILFNHSRRKTCFDEQWTTGALVTWKEAMLTKVRQTWEEEHNDSVIEDDEAPRQVKNPDLLDKYPQRPQL